MPSPGGKAESASSVAVPVRRILCLGLVAGYIDAIGFLDLGGIYVAAMTGNTVQFGITFAREQWAHFAVVAITLGSFFCGGLVSSIIRRFLPHPPLELLVMAALVTAAQLVRSLLGNPIAVELPLLAIAMAMQGQTLSRFGGLSIQTIVVTNNLLKLAEAIVGRYVSYDPAATGGEHARASRADILLPGCAWLSYALGAATGTWAALNLALPLVPPVVLLVLTTLDLVAWSPDSPGKARDVRRTIEEGGERRAALTA